MYALHTTYMEYVRITYHIHVHEICTHNIPHTYNLYALHITYMESVRITHDTYMESVRITYHASGIYTPHKPGICTPYETASLSLVMLLITASTSAVDTFSPFQRYVSPIRSQKYRYPRSSITSISPNRVII